MVVARDVIQYLEELYPLELAEDWDHPGLCVGNPDVILNRIVLALDPTFEVLEYIKSSKNDNSESGTLLITHHPLFFRPAHKVGSDTFRGRFVEACIKQDVVLYNAHTNADAARLGVGDALAALIGLDETVPLIPHTSNLDLGIGRVGNLKTPCTGKELAEKLHRVLPNARVKLSGDLMRRVSKVAVAPGAGDGFFDAVEKSGADVYITSDLRHHPVLDAKYERDFAIIDVPHYSSEFPWVTHLANLLSKTFNTLPIQVYDIPTDPWDYVLPPGIEPRINP